MPSTFSQRIIHWDISYWISVAVAFISHRISPPFFSSDARSKCFLGRMMDDSLVQTEISWNPCVVMWKEIKLLAPSPLREPGQLLGGWAEVWWGDLRLNKGYSHLSGLPGKDPAAYHKMAPPALPFTLRKCTGGQPGRICPLFHQPLSRNSISTISAWP